MPVNIDGLEFTGPVISHRSLPDGAGVYIVINPSLSDEQIIDVGESSNVRKRLKKHERKSAWKRHSRMIFFAVLLTPNMSGLERRRLVSMIRGNHSKIPCDIGVDPETGESIIPESIVN